MSGEPASPARPKRSDLVLSLALPAAVIALGIALSLGTETVGAFVDLCLAPFR